MLTHISRQTEEDNLNLAVDCETGEVTDMLELGIVDPAPVKIYALKAAMEIACAILRIDTIIKKKDEEDEGNKKGTQSYRSMEEGF